MPALDVLSHESSVASNRDRRKGQLPPACRPGQPATLSVQGRAPTLRPVPRLPLLALLMSLAVLAPAAVAHVPLPVSAGNEVAPRAAGRAITTPCPGDPIAADKVITGDFGKDLQGSNVLVPFDVPAGTTTVRVKYCFDTPDTPLREQIKHTLDLGLYEGRDDASRPWGPGEFRGWGGSSHPDVTVSPEGFSTEEQYRAKPKGHVPGKTTRGFRPGPIEPGQWAAELGVAAVVTQAEGDADGRVAWRIEIDLGDAPTGEPYTPTPYPRGPVKREAGWYAGDFHVHGEHSALGDATMTELFGFAFKPRAEGGAGLDFLTLSDYVSGSSWAEIGRYQPSFPGKLILRSAEVITYRGHLNSHANATNMDYRTGPLYEWTAEGAPRQVREATAPSATFARIHAAGGFTQVNHPTIFPSEIPLFQSLCRGCPWDYTDEESGYSRVDSWEVHTGPAGTSAAPGAYRPGPNPFTLTAIEEWDALRREGHRVAAVASSDSHNAGRTNGPTQAPIGQGTTVVYADELSERGVQRAVRSGHAFVKLWASDDPDLRFDAVTEDGVKAMMGDPLRATRATFTARVLGGAKDGQERQLIVLKDGSPVETIQVEGDDFTHEFTGDGAGNYRIQLQRGSAIDALTNPITLGVDNLAIVARKPKQHKATRGRTRFGFAVRLRAQDRTVPLAGAVVRLAGKQGRTGPRGRTSIVTRARPGRLLRATITAPGAERRVLRIRAARR